MDLSNKQALDNGTEIKFHQEQVLDGMFSIGDVDLTFYSPEKLYYGSKNISTYNNNEGNASNRQSSTAKAINSQSPYMVMKYKSKTIMLTGDATEKNEEEYIALSVTATLVIDIIKVQHHGSDDGNNLVFYQRIRATYAVISVGKNNYGHPTSRVMDNLKKSGIRDDNLYTTQTNGNVVASIDSGGTIGFGSAIANDVFWVTYWQMASSLLLIVAAVLFTNEIIYLSRKKRF